MFQQLPRERERERRFRPLFCNFFNDSGIVTVVCFFLLCIKLAQRPVKNYSLKITEIRPEKDKDKKMIERKRERNVHPSLLLKISSYPDFY